MTGQSLIAALTGAANYIDTLGGNSQSYRITIAAAIRADERGSAEPVAVMLESGVSFYSEKKMRSLPYGTHLYAAPAPAPAPARAGSEPGMREALVLARAYVEVASRQTYDGTNGDYTRDEAKRRLALIDAALAATPEQPAQAQPAVEWFTSLVNRMSDETSEPWYGGYESPHTFDDGVTALADAIKAALAAAPKADTEADSRPCTCHPDDRPAICQKKYAASECQQVAAVPLPKPAFVIEVNDEPDIPVFTAEQMYEFRGAHAAVPDVTLTWIADRLVNVYRENPNTDFVLALRRAAVEKAEMLLKKAQE